ncbi:MAG: hypothetical protein OEM96_05460 [Gemmatimonadota bacterium]|nr:hypothetical protein [Gemmatimonadota bacterium]
MIESIIACVPKWSVRVLAMAVVCAGAEPAWSQTPFTAVGLGVPVSPVDARAAAMGGTGLGLLNGGSVSARNPADMGFFVRPVLGITYSPESITVKAPGGGELSSGRSRLGVLRGAVPFDDWTLGVAFASELDQDWQIEFSDTLTSSLGTFPFIERRTADGGVSSVNFTLTRRISRLRLGVEYGIVTGNLRQLFVREFEPDTADVGNRISTSGGATSWSYGGSRIRLGAAADVSARLRVSADVSFQGDLTAERDSVDVLVDSQSFQMPAAFEAGASARLTPRILVSGAAGWTGWSGTEGVSTEFVASDVVWFGVGVELTGTRLLGANLPLRLGVRRTDLPFHAPGMAQPSETAITFGFGLRVGEERAKLDIALEFGSRGDLAASGVEESFQRLSLSLALFQL